MFSCCWVRECSEQTSQVHGSRYSISHWQEVFRYAKFRAISFPLKSFEDYEWIFRSICVRRLLLLAFPISLPFSGFFYERETQKLLRFFVHEFVWWTGQLFSQNLLYKTFHIPSATSGVFLKANSRLEMTAFQEFSRWMTQEKNLRRTDLVGFPGMDESISRLAWVLLKIDEVKFKRQKLGSFVCLEGF